MQTAESCAGCVVGIVPWSELIQIRQSLLVKPGHLPPSGFLSLISVHNIKNSDFSNNYQARPFLLSSCLKFNCFLSPSPQIILWCFSLLCSVLPRPCPPYWHYPCLVSLMKQQWLQHARPLFAQHTCSFTLSVWGLASCSSSQSCQQDKAGTWIPHPPRAAPCKAVSIARGALTPWEKHGMARMRSLQQPFTRDLTQSIFLMPPSARHHSG